MYYKKPNWQTQYIFRQIMPSSRVTIDIRTVVTPDDGMICRNILSQSIVFFVTLKLVNTSITYIDWRYQLFHNGLNLYKSKKKNLSDLHMSLFLYRYFLFHKTASLIMYWWLNRYKRKNKYTLQKDKNRNVAGEWEWGVRSLSVYNGYLDLMIKIIVWNKKKKKITICLHHFQKNTALPGGIYFCNYHSVINWKS
jgi:hypothetical protein